MKIAYQDWSPRKEARRLVDKANEIIAEYESDGFDLTLRQLYYQFVSRDLLANKQEEYKRLGDIISRARRAGMISWDAIVDRTRMLRGFSSWDSPRKIVESCASQFKVDLWRDQPWRVEVWFEKDALLGVFERACEDYRIPHFSCRGYASDSEVWSAAQRLKRSRKDVLILHFGDHDPSGLDMSRDIEDRLALFAAGRRVEVRRIALTRDQIDEYDPPPNPAKDTDSRFAAYRAEHGDSSWELDALDPRTLAELVRQEVEQVVDASAWEAAQERETAAREDLQLVADRLDDVVAAVRTGKLHRGGRVSAGDSTDIREAVEDGWLPIVYQRGGDLLSREVGWDGDVLVLRESGGEGQRWRYDDAEGLLEEVGGTVWPCLQAYRDGASWQFFEVLSAITPDP